MDLTELFPLPPGVQAAQATLSSQPTGVATVLVPMDPAALGNDPVLAQAFGQWLEEHSRRIRAHALLATIASTWPPQVDSCQFSLDQFRKTAHPAHQPEAFRIRINDWCTAPDYEEEDGVSAVEDWEAQLYRANLFEQPWSRDAFELLFDNRTVLGPSDLPSLAEHFPPQEKAWAASQAQQQALEKGLPPPSRALPSRPRV